MKSLLDCCIGENCPLRLKCARYRATVNDKEEFLIITPYDHDKKDCQFYITSISWMEIENILNGTTGGMAE